jgi:serine protease Do
MSARVPLSKKRLAVLGAALLFAAGVLATWHGREMHVGTLLEGHANAQPPVLQPNPHTPLSLADIAERSLPSVVNISTSRTVRGQEMQRMPFFSDPFFRDFFGFNPGQNQMPQERREQSLGSGVIVSSDGLILTNNHVVQNSDKIRVTLSNHEEHPAKVVGVDPKSDLALLRLQGRVRDLRTLAFGDSAKMRLGDMVLAIGNPFGVGQTVTMGIVSAKGRANMGIVDYEDFIQTDAAINPGNSGGALINMQGELVGINTAILSRTGGYQGIGFAIPSNMARPIMESLLKSGKVVRGWLGVAIQELTPDLAKAMGTKETQGVLISDVTPGSPAARAGLKRGDVALRINGEPMHSMAHLRNVVASHSPGTTLALDVLRNGKQATYQVKLGEQPASMTGGRQLENQGVLRGLGLSDLTPATRSHFHIPGQVHHGVVVETVEPGSSAASEGLRPGDVILEVNRNPVDSVQKFNQVYGQSGSRVLLLLYRDGSTMFLLLSK